MVFRWLEAIWEDPARRASFLRYGLWISTAMLALGFVIIIVILSF